MAGDSFKWMAEQCRGRTEVQGGGVPGVGGGAGEGDEERD